MKILLRKFEFTGIRKLRYLDLVILRYFFVARESIVQVLMDTSLILLPLLGPMIPIFCLIGKLWYSLELYT